MAYKAVKITGSNIGSLSQRYGVIEDARTPLEVGLYFVAPFSEHDEMYEVLTFENLKEGYILTSETLNNGFFRVEKK